MKYLVILVLVVLIVRVDVFLRLFDRVKDKLTRPAEVQTMDLQAPKETIPLAQDANLKQTPREVFLALLSDFRADPSPGIRMKALDYFKEHPTIFNDKLDTDLEAAIYRWRDLLTNNDPEVVKYLTDLLNVLHGENLSMIKRFFSLWMEIDMGHFVTAYSHTKDTNCMIATTLGDSIPEEEKLNEYYERQDALKGLLAKENLPVQERELATNCELVLSLEINKRTTPPETQP